MRRLMWFSIGFAAACATGAYFLSGMWLILLAGISCVLAITVGIVFRKKIPVIVLVGLAVGFCYFYGYDQIYLENARDAHGNVVNSTITISDYSYETEYGVAADGEILLNDGKYKVKVYCNDYFDLEPGDVITGDFSLRFTGNNNYHMGDGVFLVVSCRDNVTVLEGTNSGKLTYFAAGLRKDILALIDRLFPADVVGFARALILGDTTRLSYEEDTAFKVSGIRHVVAVSGLHVSILFSLAYLLSGKKRIMTAVVGIPVLLLFAAMAGFTPSITRACVMQMLMILALLFNREYDPPTALGFAVLLMLALNPFAITSVSLQLSVGCMIGIFLFSGKLYRWITGKLSKKKSLWCKLLRGVAASVSVSLGAMAVTTPLSAYYFGMVSIVGVITNLVALWVISFVFYGIMLTCVVGWMWISAGHGIAWLIAWVIRYVQMVAHIMSKPSFAAVYTDSIYVLIWLIGCYAMLAVFFLINKRKPILLAGCVVASLALALALSYIEPKLDNYRVTVLDVGQGQSILVQSGDKYYLVDCGGDSAAMAANKATQALLSQGVNHLDGLILTHYDKDHASGVPLLLTRIGVDKLYLPNVEDSGSVKSGLQDAYGSKIHWITETENLADGKINFMLFPGEHKDDNEGGTCILFQIENCDILITGDRSTTGENALLRQTQLPELELLIIGHHGSSNATGFQLLAQTKPKAAVISVGAGNKYGHPAVQTLNKLKLFTDSVKRTDIDGTIIYRG